MQKNIPRKRKHKLIILNCLCQEAALRNDIKTRRNGDRNGERKIT